MNESFNYLGARMWWVRQRITNGAGTTALKTVPPWQGTPIVAAGVADAGGSTTTMVDAARTEADDFWNKKVIRFTSGTNTGLVRRITDFDAATDTMTFAPAVNAGVGAGDTYDILPEAAITNRLVVTGYSISGNNTNAAATLFEIRHAGSTNEVLVGGVIPATSGSIQKDNANCWLPMIANQSLQINVATHTGTLDVTVFGRMFEETVALADFYDGAAH